MTYSRAGATSPVGQVSTGPLFPPTALAADLGDYDVRGSIDERSTGSTELLPRYLASSPGLGKAWARGYTSISSSATDAIAQSGAGELS